MITRYDGHSLQRSEYPERSESGQVAEIYAHRHITGNRHPQQQHLR